MTHQRTGGGSVSIIEHQAEPRQDEAWLTGKRHHAQHMLSQVLSRHLRWVCIICVDGSQRGVRPAFQVACSEKQTHTTAGLGGHFKEAGAGKTPARLRVSSPAAATRWGLHKAAPEPLQGLLAAALCPTGALLGGRRLGHLHWHNDSIDGKASGVDNPKGRQQRHCTAGQERENELL